MTPLRRRWLLGLSVSLLLASSVSALARADSSFVSSVNLGTAPLRSDFTGSVGMQITVGSNPIYVTQLCRYYVSGNVGTHTLALATTSGASLASVSIDMSGGTPDGNGFKCAALTNGVTLSANSSYYLTSAETSGGDQWRDYNVTLTPASGAGTIPSAVYLYNGAYTTYGSTGNSYGPVNLYYTTATSRTGTFYIDNRAGSNCSDGNAGTSPSAPWCTFDNVNGSTFGAGSQILLARGATWYQSLRPSGSGTSTSWDSIDAYGSGPKPIIRGNDNAADRTIVLTNPDYWSISDIEVSHAGEGIVVDYTTLNHTGLTFSHIYAHDITAIFHRSPQQVDFPNIWNSAAITIGLDSSTPTASQWVVKDVTVDTVETYNTASVYIAVGGGLTTVSDYSGYPPNSVQNVVIKNGYFHYSAAPMIALESAENSFVHSNHIDCSGHVAEAQGTTCFFNWRTTNVSIANNVLANMPDTSSSDETAIDVEAYEDQMSEVGNFFYNNAGAGIELLQLSGRPGDYSTNNTISGNTFLNNGIGTGWQNTYIWEDSTTGSHAGGTIGNNLTNGVQNGNFSNFTETNNLSVTAANTSNAAWSFGATQGGSNWSYQFYDGSNWLNMPTFDSTNNWWSKNNAFVGEMRMAPDSNGASWVCRMWTAPRAGTIEIRGQVFKNDVSGGDGVGVLIAKNNTVIWPSGGGTYSIGATDQIGLSSNVGSVSVAAGDQIRFEVWDGPANNSTSDTTTWMPSISYTN